MASDTPAEPLYKVLSADGSACYGGQGRWPLPRNGEPGAWKRVHGELVACEHGLHLCRRSDLILWLGPAIYLAEASGDRLECANKIVVRKARLVRRIEAWTERTARIFAADCAERVLPIFERMCPGDDRPRRAIEAARAFARGEIGVTARDAARDAARAAALAAARDAALAAARDAAWDAARDAAMAAAGDAARAAARDAAMDAARDAAGDAAGDAERDWQTERLFDYLEGRAS